VVQGVHEDNEMDMLNEFYFIALGMIKMIRDQEDEERVMDYIKLNFTEDQKKEIVWEEGFSQSMYNRMREHFAEKGC